MLPSPDPALFQDDAHPRLFFGPGDLPAVRDRACDGIPARALAEILRRCERYTDPAGPDYVDPKRSVVELLEGFGGGRTNKTADALHCMAFAYALTGDERWAAAALPLLRTIAAYEGPLPKGGFETDVCYASFGGQVTLAYDLLHPILSAFDRDALARYLRRRVVVQYEKDVLEPRHSHSWGLGTNVFWRNAEKYLLALAAVYRPGTEDEAKVRRFVKLLREGIHLGVDEGGAIYEGPSYGQRDAEWLAFMAEVLRRLGMADLWAEEPRFASLFRHWVHLVLPGGRGQNNYCDATRHAEGRPHIGLLLSAHRLQDPTGLWAWAQLGGRGEYPGSGPAPECFTHNLGQVILWEDDSLQPLPPDQGGYPAARTSGAAGVMTMRSGWSDQDAMLSLLASSRTHGCLIHQQVDAGHFSFFALNEAFSVDSGYGDILGRFHSVLRPQGEDPSRAPRGFDHMWFGGRPLAFAAGKGADYAAVNTAEQWECYQAYRHALLIKAPAPGSPGSSERCHGQRSESASGVGRVGDHGIGKGASTPAADSRCESAPVVLPYALILDQMVHRAKLERYQWLLNSEPGNRIELDHAGERAVIHGRQHRLEVAWAYPGAEEYPTPHQLRLEADEIDSHPHGQAPAGPHGMHGQGFPAGWGMGRRPRLKADLLGYNGQLLSALLPRRAEMPAVQVRWISGREQYGLVIDHGEAVDTVVASVNSGDLSLAGIEGEATLAILRHDRRGRLCWWAAIQCYSLAFEGRTLYERQGEPAALAE